MPREICQVNVVHHDSIAKTQKEMPSDERISALTDIFKLLGEPTRMRILLALASSQMCVCDLASLLSSTPSAVSHQLRLLRTAGLVHYRKEGKMVYYSLRDQHVRALLAEGLHYLEEKDG